MQQRITSDGDPFSRNNSIVDTRSAIVVDEVAVVALDEPSQRRDIYGLELAGRVNRSSARSDVLYLVDAEGAAHIAAEIIGLFGRAGGHHASEFQAHLDAKLAAQPKGGRP